MREMMDCFEIKKIKCVMFTRKSMDLPNVEQYNDFCTVIRLHNGEAEPIDKGILWQFHEENLNHLEKYIAEHGKPLVIHSVYWNSGRLAMELSKKIDVPYVHSVISNSRGRVARGAVEKVSIRDGYEQQVFERAKWVICVSNEERDDLHNFYSIPLDRIIVAGQYIHQSFWIPAHDRNGFPRLNSQLPDVTREQIANKINSVYSISSDERFWTHKAFTYMGRVGFNKGLEQIISAWYELYLCFKDECPPLWIAGGSLAEIHSVRAKMSRKKHRPRFIGGTT
jgi:glycosyltransferase involved in cell wall biosynthesis